MEKEVLDKKIRMFSQLVDYTDNSRVCRVVAKNSDKNERKDNSSFVDSKTQSNTGSLRTSGVNSISFSLVSNEVSSKSKKGSKKNSLHNKSIFI